MQESIKRSRVGLADPTVKYVALGGDALALVAGDELRLVSLAGAGDPRVVSAHRLGWSPGGLSLSPSGRYALLRDADESRLALYDPARGATALEFFRTSEKPYPVPGALASVGGEEVLLVSPRPYELEAYYLKDMTRAFLAPCNYPKSPLPFVFTHLHTHGADARTVFALGYFLAEMLDSLATFSFEELAADPSAAARELRGRGRINDHADRLAAGPCGTDCAVFFRDPGDNETPDEEDDRDDEEDEEDEERGELWNFRGLYVRRVSDGSLVERLEYDAPIATGAPIFATERFFVVGREDGVELLPRAAAEAVDAAAMIPGRVYGLDHARRRFAVLDEAGDVEIIEVP
ncbi:MAG TPA: hypothetical protein VF588_00525 [Pyrinomonadaceae bacterium]|jgi:hypothetical protein